MRSRPAWKRGKERAGLRGHFTELSGKMYVPNNCKLYHFISFKLTFKGPVFPKVGGILVGNEIER